MTSLVDSHNHVEYIDKDAAGVITEMNALGIEQCWLLTWYLPPAEDNDAYHRGASPMHLREDGTQAAMPLSGVVEAARRWPGRFVAGYCPDPREGDAAALFEMAYHIHNVRVCGEWSFRMLLDDPRAVNLFRKAGELGCPVVLHMDVPYLPDGDGGWTYQTCWHGGTVDHLERALQACPDTVFVGHAPGFWREISGDADSEPAQYPSGPIMPGGKLHRLFETYEHLWADLSAGSGLTAMRRDVEHARQFITIWQDRLLFGRDQHGDALLRFLRELDIPDAVREKVFHLNALRLVS